MFFCQLPVPNSHIHSSPHEGCAPLSFHVVLMLIYVKYPIGSFVEPGMPPYEEQEMPINCLV